MVHAGEVCSLWDKEGRSVESTEAICLGTSFLPQPRSRLSATRRYLGPGRSHTRASSRAQCSQGFYTWNLAEPREVGAKTP